MTDYLILLGNDHCRAFLSLIRRCEGANYNTLFGGGAFSGWADHPRQKVTRQSGGRPLTSTAAGAYQFLARTWDDCRAATGLPDFSPASQDIAALWLIDRREALADVIAGDWLAAIGKCNKEWASLPGSPYGQPTRSLEFCIEHLRRALVSAPPLSPAAEKGEGGREKGGESGGGLPFPLPPSPFPGEAVPLPAPRLPPGAPGRPGTGAPRNLEARLGVDRQPDGAARRRHRHREGLWLPHSARRRRDRYAGFCRCCCRRPVPVLVHHGHHPPHRPAARP